MISTDISGELVEVAAALRDLGRGHAKCLSCHCYREIADEAVSALEAVLGHPQVFVAVEPVSLEVSAADLRRLLDSTPGAHG